jgi:methylated-DNA-protein-cysteine methyltransferase-like protein
VGFGELQRGLLEREGVTFDDSGRVDLARLQWWPDEEPQGAQPGLDL